MRVLFDAIVTRNAKDFSGSTVTVIEPSDFVNLLTLAAIPDEIHETTKKITKVDTDTDAP